MSEKRILKMENGFNFRELGGYETQDGHHIKWNKLIRSGSLGELSEWDMAYLTAYGVRYDIDFRSPKEVLDVPDKLPSKVKYQFTPIFNVDETKNSDGTLKTALDLKKHPTEGYQHMLRVYDMIINERHAKAEYRRFFDALLANDQPREALLFHCTAGKDRTGMGAVFLLSALGVDWQTIQADYLLSNPASTDHVNARMDKLRKQGASDDVMTSVKALWTVDPRYLDTALAMIKKRSGNMQHYLRTELKLTKREIADLRQIYLE